MYHLIRHIPVLLLLGLALSARGLDQDISTRPSVTVSDPAACDTVRFGVESPLFKKGVGLYREALTAYMNGRYEEAVALFEKVLTIDPLHEECFMLLNRAKAKLGIEEVKKALGADTTRALLERQQTLYREGMENYLKKNLTEAQRKWKLLSDLNPEYPLLASYLGKVEREIDLQKQTEQSTRRADRLFQDGSSAYMQGDRTGALALLDSALRIHPLHAEAAGLVTKIREETKAEVSSALQKGMILFEQRNYRGAIEVWQNALRFDSTNTAIRGHIQEARSHADEIEKLHLSEARKYLSDNQLKKAMNEYQIVLDLAPDNVSIKHIIDSLAREYDTVVGKRYKDAVKLFEKGEYKEAASALEILVRLDPSHASAREYLEKSHQHLAQERAEEQVRQLTHDAEQQESGGQFGAAAALWQQVLDLDSLNSQARQRLLECNQKAQTQKKDMAVQDMFSRSVTLYQRGMMQEAKNLWDQILARDPKNEMVLGMMKKIDAEIRQQLKQAKTFAARKKWRGVVTACERVLKIDPDNAAAKNELSAARRSLSAEEAQEKKEAAAAASAGPAEAAVDPQKINELFNKGLDFYMQKKFDAALAEWNKILAVDPGNARAKTYIENLKIKLERLKQL